MSVEPISAFAAFHVNGVTEKTHIPMAKLNKLKKKKSKNAKKPTINVGPNKITKKSEHFGNTINSKKNKKKKKKNNIILEQGVTMKNGHSNNNSTKITVDKQMEVTEGQKINFLKPSKDAQKTKDCNSSVTLNATPMSHNTSVTSVASTSVTNISFASTSEDLPPMENSIDEGKKIFNWIISDIPFGYFFNNYWESQSLCVHRKCPEYYQSVISIDAIDKMFREETIEFTKNVDITSYRNGLRETHNPVGRATGPVIWKFYQDGCSIRLLNPQTYLPRIQLINATLQEFFHCMVGTNVYLTPANSQGFAPHYDDIEAFVLQVEGKKHWRLYKPRNENEFLPQTSSGNLNESDLDKPFFDEILEAGDLLYFPRGTIHQAYTVKNHHSLHVTLSVYQKNSFGDLFEKLLPIALKDVIRKDITFRKGLPMNIWHECGVAHSETNDSNSSTNVRKQKRISTDRQRIEHVLRQLFGKLLINGTSSSTIDNAVDQLALKYQHDALPPILQSNELRRTVYGRKMEFDQKNGFPLDEQYNLFNVHTEVRLIRANILRLIKNIDVTDADDATTSSSSTTETTYSIYYNVDNSKEYHEYEPNYLEVYADDVPAIRLLIKTYPNYIKVSKLFSTDEQHGIEIAKDLWERGLLMVKDC